MALLELRHVTRRFGALEAVHDVSLSVEAGEFFTLLGPSGCGKTTLLRMIAGFDQPDEGQILLDGKDLADTPPEDRPIHTVFQSYALFPHLSVADNVAFPLKMAKRPADEIARRVREALEEVRLADKAQAYPHELSGGQKQRVALARGLVNRPRLLLLDEPLGALDAKLREEMQVELINLQRNVGITFVFVTHAQIEALALSTRIAVMSQGVVEQVDEPDRLYCAPRNRFVADFIGKINLLDGHVIASGSEGMWLEVAGLGKIVMSSVASSTHTSKGTLAIRPEQVRILGVEETTTAENCFQGTVRDLIYHGDVTIYTVLLANGLPFKALKPNSAPGRAKFFEVGDAVRVAWPKEAGIFLDH
ncbi:MAG: ABC transporter ATP-binding protein [Methylophilaceae bacterium]|nr:ABC transporter ATP-binding protein [Methylophilaceae bacterium]